MKKSNLWRGATALLIVASVGSVFAWFAAGSYSTSINSYLGISTTKMVSKDSGTSTDTTYYPSAYGPLSAENLQKLIGDTYQQSVREMEEGAVLVRNENSALPLGPDERRITLFGHAVVQPVYRTNAAGSDAIKTGKHVVDLVGALTTEGFAINPPVLKAYQSSSVERSTGFAGFGQTAKPENPGEESLAFYTPALQSSWANDYHQVAVVMLAREGGEDVDMKMHNKLGLSALSLQPDEKALLNLIHQSGKFRKLVVLINSPYPVELGWLKTYGVDACLWIGTPGQSGFDGVAHLLTGKANPSGHLVDTYASNSLSAPSVVNAGQNTPTWANLDQLTASGKVTDGVSNTGYVNTQVEGLYVGYKYYETRYEDSLIHPESGASSTVGSSTGKAWNYDDEVVYPFGYGLSYTTYDQALESVSFDASQDRYTAQVKVTNTGKISGSSVVELYAQTPYGEYERKNLVEKSAIQLVGFGKTALLAPGQSQEVEVSVDRYLLASYDTNGAKGYILSSGTYFFALGSDVHEALKNILTAKGVLKDGNPKSVYRWTQDQLDSSSYRYGPTGVEVTNRFQEADLNTWKPGSVRYLTRQDWKGSFPTKPVVAEASPEMMTLLQGETYQKPVDAPTLSSIPQGVNHGLSLVDMRTIDYSNNKIWDQYLDQFTMEQLGQELTDQFGTKAQVAVGKPNVNAGDGCDSFKGRYLDTYGDPRDTCVYPAVVVLSASWDPALIQSRGSLMGEEALYAGVPQMWTGGGNLHRNPFGGRNGEYFSEDANYNALATSLEFQALMAKGVQPGIKHVAGNDQEEYRQGLVEFFPEQAWRESDLRSSEGALRFAKANSYMQAYNRIGLRWASSSAVLNNDVIRGEWGFVGMAITDAIPGKAYTQHFATSLDSGTDQYCLDFENVAGPGVVKAIQSGNDGHLLLRLRNAVKNYHYALSRSNLVNGMDSNVRMVSVTPWWQMALMGLIAVFVVLTVVAGVFTVRRERTKGVSR